MGQNDDGSDRWIRLLLQNGEIQTFGVMEYQTCDSISFLALQKIKSIFRTFEANKTSIHKIICLLVIFDCPDKSLQTDGPTNQWTDYPTDGHITEKCKSLQASK